MKKMNKIAKVAVSFLILSETFSLFPQESTPIPIPPRRAESPADDYYDADEITAEVPKKSQKKSLLGILSDEPPEDFGTGAVCRLNLTGSRAASQSVEFLYYPSTDEIVLLYKNMGVQNYICFDRKMRDKCRSAFSMYETDFDEKYLTKKNKKSYKAYGSLTGKYRWGVMNGASVAKPKTNFGYRFIKKSPYFSICYEECLAEHPGQSDENAERFRGDVLLFTKAQMKAVLSVMDEAKILAVKNLYEPETSAPSAEVPADEY